MGQKERDGTLSSWLQVGMKMERKLSTFSAEKETEEIRKQKRNIVKRERRRIFFTRKQKQNGIFQRNSRGNNSVSVNTELSIFAMAATWPSTARDEARVVAQQPEC